MASQTKRAPESNYAFASRLRVAVTNYFSAITEWELQFKKFSRLSGAQYRVPADLTGAQAAYTKARAAIEPLLPRARQLCRRYEINDPWPWILRIQLGMESDAKPALGPNERSLILSCLREMEFRAAEHEGLAQKEKRREQPAIQYRGLLRRFFDFFL